MSNNISYWTLYWLFDVSTKELCVILFFLIHSKCILKIERNINKTLELKTVFHLGFKLIPVLVVLFIDAYIIIYDFTACISTHSSTFLFLNKNWSTHLKHEKWNFYFFYVNIRQDMIICNSLKSLYAEYYSSQYSNSDKL